MGMFNALMFRRMKGQIEGLHPWGKLHPWEKLSPAPLGVKLKTSLRCIYFKIFKISRLVQK
jgi:hypothetical protein